MPADKFDQERKSPPPPQVSKGGSPSEIGDTGGIAISGIIVNDDYNNKLTGRTGVQIFSQMRFGDATVNSSMLAIQLPILSARWWVEPPVNASRLDTKIAQFVEDELMKNGTRTWQETLTEILDYLVYGRMPFEIVWEFREDEKFGRPMIGLRKLARRDPATIVAWKLKNGEPGLLQQTVNGQFEIPIEKCIVFINQKRGDNWEGTSLLRTAFKHWYMKDKLYLIDSISAERQGLGIPKGKLGTGAKSADRTKLEEVLRNIRANEKANIIIEGDIDVEFMDMKAGTTKPLLPTIQHHDRAIVLNVLAQFLQLGSTSVGSFALSNDQSKLFILSLEAIANYIRDDINRNLIKKLVDYNFNVTAYPELRFEKIGNVDHNMLTTSLQRAVQTGLLIPQPEDEVYLRDVMDLPEKSEYKDADPTMFDSILTELSDSMGSLDETFAPSVPDASMTPEEVDQMTQQASEDYKRLTSPDFIELYGEEVLEVFKGGKTGVPLSEETKRKISEALKKNGTGKSKGTKGKKPKDAVVEAKRKEMDAVRKQVRDLSNEYRMKALEMKAKGQKLSEQESAKMQLELMGKKNALQSKIDTLKSDIEARKAQTAPKETPAPAPAKKKASEVGETLDRINKVLDGYEK